MTFLEFGFRNARLIDQADFVDRRPDELPVFAVAMLGGAAE